MSEQGSDISRRQFVKTTAAAAAAFMIVPRHVLGKGFQAPSDSVHIATVGLHGVGGNTPPQVRSENIVAFCDVDYALLDNRIKGWQDSLNQNAGGRQGGAGGGGQQ